MKFVSQASRPHHALALIYDLEGFSRFFNQPDVQDYVPRFLNHVSSAISVSLFGGDSYWTGGTKHISALLPPIHQKFLGDGALYIWTPAKGQNTFEPKFLTYLCNRLWTLKNQFRRILEEAACDVPVVDVPSKIRFGLAREPLINACF
jgi:hypothetical protein